jgi:hypothetical protein|tara:strand:+ start:91 stop:1443 length:1353 start_codon:yes stop_codon:yes gene_type:complete
MARRKLRKNVSTPAFQTPGTGDPRLKKETSGKDDPRLKKKTSGATPTPPKATPVSALPTGNRVKAGPEPQGKIQSAIGAESRRLKEVSPVLGTAFDVATAPVTGKTQIGGKPTSGLDLIPGTGVVGKATTGAKVGGKAGIRTGKKILEKSSRITTHIDDLGKLGQSAADGSYTSATIDDAAKGITQTYKIEAGSGAVIPANTKTENLIVKSLSAVVTKLKNPWVVAGIILSALPAAGFSEMMTANTKGDITKSMIIAQNDAYEANDMETVLWTEEVLAELNEPTVQNWLESHTPFLNWRGHELKNTQLGYEVANRTASRMQEEQAAADAGTPIPDSPQWWAEKDERDAAAEAEYFRQMNLLQDRRDELSATETESFERSARMASEEAELERQFWSDYQAAEEKRAEEERAYWLAKEGRDEARAQAEKEYWAQVRAEEAGGTPSKLGFGLL